MSKTMPKTPQEEKYRWIKPVLDKQMKLKDLISVCPFSERTIKYWLAFFRQRGLEGLIPKSTRPKSNPKETPIRIKERVLELRKEHDKCALKLHWSLEKEGVFIHARTIGKILKSEGLTRRYRTKKVIYKYIRSQLKPGELVEIDVKYVPQKLDGKQFYQFTAIDCSSRWRYLSIYETYDNFNSIEFLKEVIKRFPYEIKAIKTDNHASYTNRYTGYLKSSDLFNPRLHELDRFCAANNIIHYLIDPGKPAQNGTVERSHRSDQQSFYEKITCTDIDQLKYQTKLWNMYYNDLEHCSLNGLSPNQILSLLKVQNVRT